MSEDVLIFNCFATFVTAKSSVINSKSFSNANAIIDTSCLEIVELSPVLIACICYTNDTFFNWISYLKSICLL